MLFTGMIGLPHSGTTSLLLGFLKRSERISNSNGLDIYQTVLYKDSVSGQSELHDITDDDDKHDAMILLSLAKFLVTKHYNLSILEDNSSFLSDESTTFQDPKMQE